MKKRFLILSSSLLALLLAGCVAEDDLNRDETWNEDLEFVEGEEGTPDVPEDASKAIDLRLFDVIDLNAPGLEKVREYYEAGKLYEENAPEEETAAENDAAGEDEEIGDKDGYYLAAWYLREYFRERTSVKYPQLEASLVNASYTANEKIMADKALEGHFYVRNFAYYEDDEKTYKDFVDFGMKTDDKGAVTSINWGMPMPEADFPNGSEQEWDSQQHRHQWMLTQAKVFRATNDKKYIDNWKGVYENWVKTYADTENANVKGNPWRALQPAERLIDQTAIFFYYLDSEEFTPEYMSFFLAEFAKTTDLVKKYPYQANEEFHNINLAQAKALFYASTLFPEFKNAEEWKTYSHKEVIRFNKGIFRADGGPVENDPSYHNGNVDSFYDISLLANANNIVLSDEFIENLRGACMFMVDIAYPNYSVDNFNDTRSVRMSKSVLKRNYGHYKEMFPDENKFLYMASDMKDGETPKDLVQLYPETGYYMLRTGWTPESAMLVLKNNTKGKSWHTQADNLTFTLYRNGIRFSPDAGCYSYDTGGDRNTYAGAAMHNTLVKGTNSKVGQGPNFDKSEGKFVGHFTGRNYEAVVAENANYNDLTHRRAVFMVDKKFYVLVDEAYGSYKGDVKLLLKGSNVYNPDTKKYDKISNFVLVNSIKDGASDVFNPEQPVTMYTTLPGTNNFMFVTYPETKTGYDSKWTTGYYSDDLGQKTAQRRVYEVRQTKETEAVRYITVLYPYGAASEYENIKIDAEFTNPFSADGAEVTVTVDNAGIESIYTLSYTINK